MALFWLVKQKESLALHQKSLRALFHHNLNINCFVCILCCRWEFTGSGEEVAKSIPYQLQKLFLQLQVLSLWHYIVSVYGY